MWKLPYFGLSKTPSLTKGPFLVRVRHPVGRPIQTSVCGVVQTMSVTSSRKISRVSAGIPANVGQGIPAFREPSGRPRRISHLLLHEGSRPAAPPPSGAEPRGRGAVQPVVPRLPHASRTSLWSVNCGLRQLPYRTAGTIISYRTVPYLTAASSRPALRVPHLITSSNY
jgi:hypothetical protein